MEEQLLRDPELRKVSLYVHSYTANFSFKFTERTPGSFIEEREASMVWRFWAGDPKADSADRQWAQRQAAEAQNHIFDSLGERYGLRIIPGNNSFLVLPNNISRSTAVGAILHPGGPARSAFHPNHFRPHNSHATSPTARQNSRSWSFSDASTPSLLSASTTLGGDDFLGGGSAESAGEIDFLLAISSDEKLLRRLNEFDGSETVSTSGRGTDAKWRLENTKAEGVLRAIGVTPPAGVN